MPAFFCESCGVRVVAPGKCKACGGTVDAFAEPKPAAAPVAQPKPTKPAAESKQPEKK